VEFLRILGCLMVIGTHLKPAAVVNGTPVRSATVIACLVGDGVTVFWMILGFFHFDHPKNYRKVLKTTFFRILLPTIVYFLFCFYLGRLAGEGATFMNSISHSREEYRQLLYAILTLRPAVFIPYAGHMWYMLAYCLIMVLYPLVYELNRRIKREKNTERFVLLILFLLLVLNDLTRNELLGFGHVGFQAAFGGIVIALFGCFLYRNRKRWEGRISCAVFGILLYTGTTLLRIIIQYRRYRIDPSDEEALYWFTGFAVLAFCGIFLFLSGLRGHIRIGKKAHVVIRHLGKMTLYVYFVHMIILVGFNNLGLAQFILGHLPAHHGKLLLYELLYTLLIFGFSLAAGELICAIQLRIRNFHRSDILEVSRRPR
jgi:hypothetical protein